MFKRRVKNESVVETLQRMSGGAMSLIKSNVKIDMLQT